MPKFSVKQICFPVNFSERGWVIHDRIGGASEFGEIHIVCKNLECDYVLKCQIIDDDDPEFLSREEVEREIRCHTAASEIGLAPEIVDVWFTDRGNAIVMKLLKETLHNQLLKIEDVEEGTKLLDNTLDALKKLHLHNIAHKDTHLKNIMLDNDDNIMFIDFGFSVCDKIKKSDKLEDYFKFKQQLEEFLGIYIRNRTNPQSKRDIFSKLQRMYVNSSDGKIINIIRSL